MLDGVQSRAGLASGGTEGPAEQAGGVLGAPRPAASRCPCACTFVLVPSSCEMKQQQPRQVTPSPPPQLWGLYFHPLFHVGSAHGTSSDSSFSVTALKSPAYVWDAGRPLHKGPVNTSNWPGRVTVNSSAARGQAARCPQQCGSGSELAGQAP